VREAIDGYQNDPYSRRKNFHNCVILNIILKNPGCRFLQANFMHIRMLIFQTLMSTFLWKCFMLLNRRVFTFTFVLLRTSENVKECDENIAVGIP